MTNTLDILRRSILELKKIGIKSAEIDAKLLLKKSISKDDVFVFSHPEYLLTNQEYGRFRRLIRKRKTGEPIAYILGHKEFYGNDFLVNKNVLIPRPETEWLVEKGVEFIKSYPSTLNNKPLTVLDMGTGTGCIIISLAKDLSAIDHRLSINFYGAEINKKAIGVAKKNSKLHKVDNYVKFYVSDLFSNRFLNKKIDLIIANLPYVPTPPQNKIKNKEEIDFEPQKAIFANDNGTEIIKNFLEQAKNHTSPKGLILLELDPRNAKEILSFAETHYSSATINLITDLAGLDRYLEIKK
jgi:release factor glutamine methyltransferase